MMAKVIVRDEIDRRINRADAPEPVAEFLRDQWFTVLLLHFLREGEEGENWRRTVDAMDCLLWSVQPKRSDRERQRLVGALGWLLEGLQEGMEMASMPEAQRQLFLTELKSCHAEALAEGRRQQAAWEKARQTHDATTRDEKRAEADAYRRDLEGAAEAVDGDAGITEEQVMAWADFSDPETADEGASPGENEADRAARYAELADVLRDEHEQVEIEEITIGDAAPEPEIEDEHSAQVAVLEKGTWVEFTQADGETVRGKLSWISPLTGTYLFTNRQGVKVADRTRKGLALEFRRGSARVIEEQSLLDQALSSILRRKEGAQENA